MKVHINAKPGARINGREVYGEDCETLSIGPDGIIRVVQDGKLVCSMPLEDLKGIVIIDEYLIKESQK